jgi:hypothetical protein
VVVKQAATQEEGAATVLQSKARQKNAVKAVEAKKQAKEKLKQDGAATKLQNISRGRMAKEELCARQEALPVLQGFGRICTSKAILHSKRRVRAVQMNVLVALPGTVQGSSGWYQEPGASHAIYFHVDAQGSFNRVTPRLVPLAMFKQQMRTAATSKTLVPCAGHGDNKHVVPDENGKLLLMNKKGNVSIWGVSEQGEWLLEQLMGTFTAGTGPAAAAAAAAAAAGGGVGLQPGTSASHWCGGRLVQGRYMLLLVTLLTPERAMGDGVMSIRAMDLHSGTWLQIMADGQGADGQGADGDVELVTTSATVGSGLVRFPVEGRSVAHLQRKLDHFILSVQTSAPSTPVRVGRGGFGTPKKIRPGSARQTPTSPKSASKVGVLVYQPPDVTASSVQGIHASVKEKKRYEAALKIQSQVRRRQGIAKTEERKEELAEESGVLQSMPGTVQGESGWYQDKQKGVVAHFQIDGDGEWNLISDLITEDKWWALRQQRLI